MKPHEHRILFDARIATNAVTGETRYITSLLKELIPLLAPDERLVVAVASDTVPMPFLDAAPFEVHHLDAPADSRASQHALARLAWRTTPEIFHATTLFTPIRIPGRMVVTLHDLLPLACPQYSSFSKRLIWRVQGWRLLRHCRQMIGVSECLLRDCARLFGPRGLGRSRLIYDGVCDCFHPQPPAALDKVRADFHLPERFFLYLGSDHDYKNLTTLLEAYALLEPTAAVPLVLAGFDPTASHVPDQITHLRLNNLIRCVGIVPEASLPALYAAAHAFVFPSLAESFGFPTLEAMACGTPVICSALSGLKEITAGAATVVHPTDRQEWKRALQIAAASLEWRDAYRLKGLARAKDFSWRRTAVATLDVYRSLYRKHVFG